MISPEEYMGVQKKIPTPEEYMGTVKNARKPSMGAGRSFDSGIIPAFKSGLQQSIPGMLINKSLPEPYEAEGVVERFAQQAGTFIPDLSIYAAGAALGAPGGPLTAAGGSFALPAGIRKVLMDKYEKGEVRSAKEFLERTGAALKETGKGYITGAAVGTVGKFAPKVVKFPAEVATMTTVPAALEGRLPEPQDFQDAFLLLGVLKVATGTPARLRKIYEKHGKKPLDVAEEYEAGTLDLTIKKELEAMPTPEEYMGEKKIPTPEEYMAEPTPLEAEKVAPVASGEVVGGEARLIEEAKKYKTAEEFVAGQPKAYHGTNVEFSEYKGDINWFTENKEYAQIYAEGRGEGKPTIKEATIDKTNLIDLGFRDVDVDVPLPEIIGRIVPNIGELYREGKVTKDIGRKAISDLRNIKGSGFKKAWEWIQDEKGIKDILKSVGYRGVMSREQGNITYGIFDPKQIKTKSQLTDIWNKAHTKSKPVEGGETPTQKKTAELFSKPAETEKGVSLFDIAPGTRTLETITVKELQEVAAEISKITKRILPVEAHNRLRVELKPLISLRGRNLDKTLKEHGVEGVSEEEILGAATFRGINATVELSFLHDDVENTAYHELYHVSKRWLFDEKTRDRMSKSFDNNEEAEAEAFADYATNRTKDARQKSFIKRLFARMKKILEAIRNYFQGKGFQTPDAVFEKLYVGGYSKLQSKDMILSRVGNAIKLEVAAYHGSPYAFDRFSMGAVGTVGGTAFGHGLYFTELEDIGRHYAESTKENAGTSKNLYKVTLHKGKKEGEYEWLDWDYPVTKRQKERILSTLKGEARQQHISQEDIDLVEDTETGQELYIRLSDVINTREAEPGKLYNERSTKEASAFLQRAGITGNRYLADSLSGMKSGEYNYVVFDESAVTIEEHTQFSIKKAGLSERTRAEIKEMQKLKAIIRRVSGQTKVADLVREDYALKETYKKAQKAYREALSAGKKEGIAKTKERYQELLARVKLRRKVREMVQKLKKVNTEKMSPGQKTAIDELLQGLDLSKRKKMKLQGTREYLENNPDAELPDYVLEDLKRLDKKSYAEMNYEDLESIYTAVMHHVHLERLKQGIRVGRNRRAANKALNEALSEMRPAEKVKSDIISSQKGMFGRARRTGRLVRTTFGIRHDHYDLIVETLAGQNSVMDKVLYQNIKEGIQGELRYKHDAFKKFQDDLGDWPTRHKITDVARWMNESVKTGNFELTRGERMSLYRHSLNDDNRRAIIEGGFGFKHGNHRNDVYRMTEDEMDAILDSLTPAEVEFAGAPVANLFEEQYRRLNEVFYEKNGYDLPQEDIYYPKDTMPLARGTDIETEEALEAFRGQWTRVGIPKGMLNKRKRVALPIYLNSLAYDINKSVLKSAAYVGLEIPMSNASNLLYNPTFRINLTKRYGEETWKEIEKGLRDIAGEHQTYTTVDELAMIAKNNLTTAILGLNPFVMAKQVVSLTAYWPYVDAEYLMMGVLDATWHPAELNQRHKAYSIDYKERIEGGYSRDVADVFKGGSERRIYGGKRTIKESVMGGIKLFDQLAVEPGMQGAVLQVLAEFKKGKLSREVRIALDMTDEDIKGLTPEAKMALAYKFADYATERTQPQFSPAHRSSLSRGSTIEKLTTMFGAFTNQALNLTRRSFREARRTGDPEAWEKFAKSLVSIFIFNTGIVMGIDELRNRLYGRKGGSLAGRIASGWAGYMFFVRDIVSSAVSNIERGPFMGYDVEVPVSQVPNKIADTGADLIAMATERSKRKRKKRALSFVDNVLGLSLLCFGIPYETPKRLISIAFGKKKEKNRRKLTSAR